MYNVPAFAAAFLGSTQIVLLVLTIVVSVLTLVPGRATRLQGGVQPLRPLAGDR